MSDNSPEANEEATASDASEPSEAPAERGLLRMEARLAKSEAQIRTLQEGVADLVAAQRAGRQRALYLRIGILVALLGAFFYLQYSGG
jgi:uncharacterized membrane protein